MNIGKITRRTFLGAVVAVGGGLAVGYYFYRKPYPNPLKDGLADGEATFNPFVKISADNSVTIIVPRAEMGQGVTTTLAALVAEELDVDLDAVHVEHGPASPAYYNQAMLAESAPFPAFDHGMVADSVRAVQGGVSKVFGIQATGGSSSVRDGYEKMRHAGCAARMMLVKAAALRWGVAESTLETSDGTVRDPASGKTATYGALAAAAATQKPPSEIVLRDKSKWRYLGKSPGRTDCLAKVTGTAGFGIDVALPDMLYGTVKMSPRFGAKAKSMDDSAALKVPGVRKVVAIDAPMGSGFGIIADNTWAAFKGAEALEVTWEEASYPADTTGLMAQIADTLNGDDDGFSLRDDGDAAAILAAAPAEELIEAEYRAPYLAHTCMEPMNATARWTGNKLELWSPNQAPTVIQMALSSQFGIESEDITVNTTFLGGGFGRRAEMDFSLYAAAVARYADGRPVKVTWSREEDVRHDAYRPAAIGRFRARVKKGETPAAMLARIAGPSPVRGVMARTFPSLPAAGPDRTVIEGVFDQPYAIKDYKVTGLISPGSIPVGFWRSVGNSFNGFFNETFLDEVAHKAGLDSVAMRFEMMKSYPTAVKVMEKVASMANWGAPLAQGHGKGVAFTLSFGSWVGQVVEVSVADDAIRIENVWCAADCGEVLDPAIFKSQVQSAIIYGLSSAMGQEITFADGEVQESNFDTYDAMRINQCPIIEVAILENSPHMGGAGEIGTPPSIPALGNAIFAATGKRIRELPLSKAVTFV